MKTKIIHLKFFFCFFILLTCGEAKSIDTVCIYQKSTIQNYKDKCPRLDSIISVEDNFGKFLVLEINENYFKDTTDDFVSIVYFVDNIIDIGEHGGNKYYYLSDFDVCALYPEHNNFIGEDKTGQVTIIINSLTMLNRFSRPEYGTFLFTGLSTSSDMGIPSETSLDSSIIYIIGEKKVILFTLSFASVIMGIDFLSQHGLKFNKLLLPISRARFFRRFVKNDECDELIPWKIVRNLANE